MRIFEILLKICIILLIVALIIGGITLIMLDRWLIGYSLLGLTALTTVLIEGYLLSENDYR